MSSQTTFLGSPGSRHKVSTPHQGSSPGSISPIGVVSTETLPPSTWPLGPPFSVPISMISHAVGLH